jgi:nicotinate-nucleotide pyrophosphorylase (carboxylating)
MGLYDGVLIKDNHLAGVAGTEPRPIEAVVARARAATPAGSIVEVEVDTLEQLDEALACSPDIVLLDNMTLETLREAVRRRNQAAPMVKLEASGGVDLTTVAGIAATGVDRISVGALTHSAPALDLGLDYERLQQ